MGKTSAKITATSASPIAGVPFLSNNVTRGSRRCSGIAAVLAGRVCLDHLLAFRRQLTQMIVQALDDAAAALFHARAELFVVSLAGFALGRRLRHRRIGRKLSCQEKHAESNPHDKSLQIG